MSLKAEVADECYLTTKPALKIIVPGSGRVSTNFVVAMGQGSHSALYPFHITGMFTLDRKTHTAHAIRIFESRFPDPASTNQSGEIPVMKVPPRGGLALTPVKTYGVSWQWNGKPLERLPIGWSGSDKKSLANLGIGPIARGETRQALAMHPPYQGGLGSLFVEYHLKLPATQAARLTFYNAIRDNSPQEPPSAGVTFRVWAGEQRLFERHTDSKSWVPGEPDLGAFAGQEILRPSQPHRVKHAEYLRR